MSDEKKRLENRVHKILDELNQAKSAIDCRVEDPLRYESNVSRTSLSEDELRGFNQFPYEYRYFLKTIGLLNVADTGTLKFSMCKPKTWAELDFEECSRTPDGTLIHDQVFENSLGLIWNDDEPPEDADNLLFAARFPWNDSTYVFNRKTYVGSALSCSEELCFLDWIEEPLLDTLKWGGFGEPQD